MVPRGLVVLVLCSSLVYARSPPQLPPAVPAQVPFIQVDPDVGEDIQGNIPNTGDRCSLPKDAGPCDKSIRRYFYNRNTLTCERFLYSGCYGNGNNFLSLQDCFMSCLLRDDHLPPSGFLNKLLPED